MLVTADHPSEGLLMVKLLQYAVLDGDDSRGSVEEYLLRCLLGAREETGIASNTAGFDEDVNVYVVGLLGRFLSAEYHDLARRFLYPTDMDLAREVRAQGDERFCYLAYRTNADQLLLGIGLFFHVEGHGVSPDPVFGRSVGDLAGRGATYYQLASSSLRRLCRRETAPELAMSKLANRFDDYTSILKRLRTSYFQLTSRLSDGVLYHLANDRPASDDELAPLWDRFLDAWTEWKKTHAPDQLDVLRDAVEALRGVDPEFSFEMPEA